MQAYVFQLKLPLPLQASALLIQGCRLSMAPKIPNPYAAGATKPNNPGAIEPTVSETTEPGGSESSAHAAMAQGLPLKELNKKTAGLGNWVLKVSKTDVIEYKYTMGTREVVGSKLRVIFTTRDEGSYCTGLMKMVKKNASELTTARDKKFKVGSLFRAQKVSFLEEKPQYIHTPFKLVLDLRSTMLTMLLTAPCEMAAQPSPPSEVADIVQIKTEGAHRFDITGLSTMSDVRYHDTARGYRAIADIEVVDGSITASGKKAVIGFALFIPCASKDAMPANMEKFKEMVDNQTPISYFGLSAVRSRNKQLEIRTPDEFYWASAVGAKAERLKPVAATLTSLSADDKEKLTPVDAWAPGASRDFLAEPAIFASLVLLDAFGSPGNASVANDKIFQANFVEVEPPGPGTKVITNEGDRIWIASATLLDHSGTVNNIGIREKAALALASIDPNNPQAKEIFQQQVRDGTVQFPMLSSIRVQLKTKPLSSDEAGSQEQGTDGASQQEGQGSQTRMTIVEAEEQDLSCAPNQSYMDLVNLISECHPRTDGLVAAPLADIRKSAHYPIAVECNGQLRACHKVLTLVASTTRAIQDELGSENLRLSTPDVLDLLGANEPDTQTKYTLVGMCSRTTLRDVLLDPPRNGKKQQAALAIITGILDEKTFLLQMVQLVAESDLPATQKLMEALVTLNRRTRYSGVDVRPNWNTPSSGLMGPERRKCRRLGACPTHEPLEMGDPTVTD